MISSDWRHSLTHVGHHVFHHFLVALALASAVLILEHYGLLNWLDSVALRTVGVMETSNPAHPSGIDAAPVPLLIGDTYFEQEFEQQSPLNRKELTRLISRIVEQKPRMLAVDIDLSPGPLGALGNAGQEELDALLIGTAKAGKLPVVLTLPYPVITDSLFEVKYSWVKSLCEAGVRFSFPHLVLSQGVAMRYPVLQPTLGVVAHLAITEGAPESTKEVTHESGVVSDVCAQIAKGPDSAVFLSKHLVMEKVLVAEELREQHPINPDYLRNVTRLQRVLTAGKIGEQLEHLEGRTVFLGSEFDARDEFLTPFGPFRGTTLHAAINYSEQHPIHASHITALVLDLVFGIIAGFIFGAIWERTNRASAKLAAHPDAWRSWLRARVWLAMALAILAIMLIGLFYGSAVLLSHNLWNNPGPMIIGVFVKSLLASRSSMGPLEPTGETTSSWQTWMIINLDWWLLSPLVVWATVIFVSH